MIHPKTELRYISKEVGYGVVATEFIPAGTITWIQDKLDREFTPIQVNSMKPIYQNILDFYTFRNNKGNFILCWDNGRYINHSFNSNCLSTAYDFEIAIRDIQPGEQLTDDYGYLNITHPFEALDEGTDRKVVYPDDLINFFAEWDEKIEKVFAHIIELEQPLQSLIEEEHWSKIETIIKEKKPLESIKTLYYQD